MGAKLAVWFDTAEGKLAAQFGRGIGIVALCLIVYMLFTQGLTYADYNGWVSHHQDTPIYIGNNWLVGEFRECGAMGDENGKLTELYCDPPSYDPSFTHSSSLQHTGGKTTRPDKSFNIFCNYSNNLPSQDFWLWRCQRNGYSNDN
ncbi:MAG: hypothetical protein ACYC46_02605, partial [Acidobacteriaceae bacterium]